MRPQRFSITPQVDVDGICQAQAASGGEAQSLTLNGAFVTDGVAAFNDADHIVSFKSSSNNSGITFTVTGRGISGDAEYSEVVTGPNNTTVYSTKGFYKITSIVVSGDTTSTVEVGSSGECFSPVVPLNLYADRFSVSLYIEVPLSPSPNLKYTVLETPDDIQGGTQPFDVAWTKHDNLQDKTATENDGYTRPVVATRLRIYTYVSGKAKFTVIQEGI